MSDEAEMRSLAEKVFGAVEAGDVATVRSLYADDCRIWHNTDDLEQTAEENLAVLSGLTKRLADRVYSQRRLEVFPGGFVQQHVLRGVLADGTSFAMPACIICRVRDGRIVRIDEYVDSARVAEFRRLAA